MIITLRIRKNVDDIVREAVELALEANDGYCPCKLDKNPSTRCMCEEFRNAIANGEIGICHCGLYEAYDPTNKTEVKSKMASKSDILGQTLDAQNELVLKVKLMSPDAKMPTRGTIDSAGYDLDATEDVVIDDQEGVQVHLGVAVEIPRGYVGLLFARSGLASKRHLRPSNCVGVIDSDYRGEVMVNLYNDNFHEGKRESQFIYKGDRIAQLVLVPYIAPRTVEVEELSDTERGEGGFGSTDKKKK